MDTETKPPLKVGLVGTGFAASKRAEALQADRRSHLVAVTGHTPETIAEFSSNYNASPVGSWQELLQDPQLDLVVICTINRDRGAIAHAAIEADKHVVAEYPLALDPQEAQAIINLAQRKNKLLHVEHIELLGGLHQAIRQNLPEIAPVFFARYITINPQRPIPQRWSYNHSMFGFPLSGALSRIHRLTDLFGKVATVNCQSRFWDTEADYYRACLCNAQLRFRNGIIAEVTYGKGETFWKGDRTFEIHGEKGTLIFAGSQGKLVRGEEETPIEVGDRRGLFTKDTTMVLDYLYQGTPLYVTPHASHYALEVAEAARISAATGKTVELS
ncbi:MAG: Gfo/Idh/MocA family oxidoreductase [Oscillatoria sp. PMC 1051.18]|nr:Gfo/Idh/MocA family oxidoreductase [Oscillatoria sp. PMC 1050.18]MEC5031860.1 Gfo/Idh/MocA family oxidoreductase [Oscillatoria sp. PMC 1051.18]